jgi:hypothetical protein
MLQVFQIHVSSVSSVFFLYILQMLHMDISKVNQVLYMGCMWEAREGTSSPCADDIGWRSPRMGMDDAGVAE